MGTFSREEKTKRVWSGEERKIHRRRDTSACSQNVFLWFSRFLCGCLALANNNVVDAALPWGSARGGYSFENPPIQKNPNNNIRPTFLSRFQTKVAFRWNGTIANGGASNATIDCEEEEEETFDDDEQTSNYTLSSIRARFLAATRNSTLANAFAEQMDNMPVTIKSFLERNWPAFESDDEEEDEYSEEVEEEDDGLVESTTISATLKTQLRESLASFKDFFPRGMIFTEDSVAVTDSYSNSTRAGVGARLLASTKNITIGTAFAEQKIRTISSMRDFLQRNIGGNSTGSIDWFAILADRILSEESALAVKKIRGILANMEDHGVVDVFSKFTSQEIAASLYALYRLQRAANRYEALLGEKEQGRQPEDLVQVLEDLSHYVLYATAAYGWKMDLAFQRKLHLGDEQALLRKTGIDKEDLIKLSMKSKAHLPVFFLARDRERKALVLCIRGTWSLHDVLTDLCCTPEEYAGPTTTPSSYLSSRRTSGQRYCAHNGMLDAAMAVAIEMEDIIEEALKDNPGYSLVLVGHSMGAGCCSLLATFWEKKFKNMKTYLFGGPCVSTMDSHPTNSTSIINVISEGDPFRCLSLGHVADLSSAVATLCEDPLLRREVLARTEGHLHDMDVEDLEYCWNKMQELRTEVMAHADKMFPPGRIFYVSKSNNARASQEEDDSDTEDEVDLKSASPDEVVIHEVGPEFFRELLISPRMFDISRHLPSLYEDTLVSLMEREQSKRTRR